MSKSHSSTAPVVLFAFNRPTHTEQTLRRLLENPEAPETDLIVYSDGARRETDRPAVQATRTMVASLTGFRSVSLRERSENLGLFRNIKEGLDEVLSDWDRVIVLEDDLVPVPNFLAFMNAGLTHYEHHSTVHSVSGFLYPLDEEMATATDAFLFPRFSCWGWGTWRDRWQAIDWRIPTRDEFLGDRALFARFHEASNDLPEILLDLIDGRNQSWSILVCLDHVRRGGLCVYPTVSKIQNIGFDGSGIHSNKDLDFRVAQDRSGQTEFAFPDQPSAVPLPLKRYFANSWKRKLKNLLKYGRYF